MESLTATVQPPRDRVMPESSRLTVFPLGSVIVTDCWSSSSFSSCGAFVTMTFTAAPTSGGTSPSRQYPPTQMGKETSLPSNSIQTRC